MFEKYWSKATYKKKKDPADEKPSAKEARPPMTKIGTCKMIAEPHTFDVTIFVVRDPNAPQPVGDRQFVVQFGSAPNQISKAPNTGTPTAMRRAMPPSMPVTPTQHGSITLKPVYHPPLHYTQAPSIVNTTPALGASSAPVQLRPTGAGHAPVSRLQAPVAQSRPTPPSPPSNRKPAAAPTVATDPVIQMLAQRATTDNALKQVMKIVASGKATPKQLDYFQGHIDELTKIVNDQAEEKRVAEEKRPAALATQQQRQQQWPQQSPLTPAAPPAQRQIVPMHAVPMKAPPKVPIPPRPVYNPPPLTPKPRTIPAPTHVLLEFGVNSADRYLFPRNSIVEYEADGTVRASFFVVKRRADLPSANPLLGKKYIRAKKTKKGEVKPNEENAPNGKTGADGPEKTAVEEASKVDAAAATATESSPKKDAAPIQQEAEAPAKMETEVAAKEPEPLQKDVFQPVTIRFEQPSDPSMMQVFGRVVAPPPEVVKWMTDVAERCERAVTARLALRLPRGSSEKDSSAPVVVD
jgi:hypothetical protein